MKKNDITLQINSLPALERLLGGDSQLEVALRESAAAAFANNRLADLITPKILREAYASTADAVSKALIEKSAELARYEGGRFHLSKVAIEAIQQVLNMEVNRALEERIPKMLEETVERVVRSYIAQGVTRFIQGSGEKELQAAIDAGVRVKLDKILAAAAK